MPRREPPLPLFDVRWILWLKRDYEFQVRVDELGRNFSARITRLSGRVDPVSQSIRVFGEITDPSADLIAGMSGRATIAPPQ